MTVIFIILLLRLQAHALSVIPRIESLPPSANVACREALAAEIPKCHDEWNWYEEVDVPAESLLKLCTTGCGQCLSEMNEHVYESCGDDVIHSTISNHQISITPLHLAIDLVWKFKTSCLTGGVPTAFM
jgi:hypothetical protein